MRRPARLEALRNQLEQALLTLDETSVNGTTLYRMPQVTNISFRFVEGEGLMMGLQKSVAVSSGSACTSASMEPSHVLKALGAEDSDFGWLPIDRVSGDEEPRPLASFW